MISAASGIQGQRFSQPVDGPTALVDLPGAVRPVSSQNPNRKKVLFVTSELADLVKTGGLGDVSAALPRAMAHLHDVRVLIPGYRQVLDSDNPIHIIGELGGHAALPPLISTTIGTASLSSLPVAEKRSSELAMRPLV